MVLSIFEKSTKSTVGNWKIYKDQTSKAHQYVGARRSLIYKMFGQQHANFAGAAFSPRFVELGR
jgi:hypothetical protein